MADNYLEKKYEEYLQRKAAAEKKKLAARRKHMAEYRKKMEEKKGGKGV